MIGFVNFVASRTVSLFTREWIEMSVFVMFCMSSTSPSLRGSGLKFVILITSF